MSGECGLLADS